jgi:hypothetical protein
VVITRDWMLFPYTHLMTDDAWQHGKWQPEHGDITPALVLNLHYYYFYATSKSSFVVFDTE